METPQKNCLVCKAVFLNMRLDKNGHRIRKWTKERWVKARYCSKKCNKNVIKDDSSRGKECLVCKAVFYNVRLNKLGQRTGRYTLKKWELAKFCSHPCRHVFMKGKPTMIPTGDKNPMWVGDRVKYSGLHYWARKHLGIHPEKCEHCGVAGKKNGRSWSIHYANISGKYKREKDDWIRLCTKCHRAFDKK